MILVGLLTCTLGGFVIGAVVGAVLGHDLTALREEKETKPPTFWEWREDLDDPEGEWK